MNVRNDLTRRQLLQFGAASVLVAGFGVVPAPTAHAASSATGRAGRAGRAGSSRRLVLVQLNGGNDGLNTVVPLDGRYHDMRPTLGLADANLVALPGAAGIGLHPALSPLVPLWNADRMAIIRGIGFDDPQRSHFVAMDRWWRADDLAAPGWLGRVLDRLPTDPEPLYATALGSGAPVLAGAVRQPTVVGGASSSFRLDGVPGSDLLRLAAPLSSAPLTAGAQRSWRSTVEAVNDFASVMDDAAVDSADVPAREGASTLAGGLATAADLLTADVGARIVVVSASGFDTHANQLPVHAGLLSDLATGISRFFASVDAAGIGDEVLLVTTSEFGRRVGQNGSGGSDHGAGGTSFAVGSGLRSRANGGGVVGEVDLGNLLDGDVRPTVDPRVMYTSCLDWLGVDAEPILGRRYDAVGLLA